MNDGGGQPVRMRLLTPGPLVLCLAVAGALPACGAGANGGTPGPGGPYGVPASGSPEWRERTVLSLTNAVRMAPADWKARWSGGLPADVLGPAYPAVSPVRWVAGLGASARQHSGDMAANACFSHDSCDGTRWDARIRTSYAEPATIGENIAAGYPDPEAVLLAWICDAEGGTCCRDGQPCDGHRRNIMSRSFAGMGVGWTSRADSPFGSYWTQDFGGKAGGSAPPLVDGTHLPRGGSRLLFLANFFAGSAPRSLTLVLEDAELPMAPALGTPAQGTWTVEAPSKGGCRAYHFTAVDAGGASFRLPEAGRFVTFGEGGCKEDFRP